MAAYWLARAIVHDAEEYQEYATRVPAVLDAHGGRILARGGRFDTVEGETPYTRFVVVEFDTLEKAVACHASPEYRAAADFRRHGAGTVEITIVEGNA